MQRTADFDNTIANTVFEEANGILHDPTALHTTIHMFDTDTTAGKVFIRRFLLGREGTTTRLLVRGLGVHIHEVEAKKATILQ